MVAPPLDVVGRQRLARKRLAPQLPGNHVHVALHARELGLRFPQHLLGRQAGVQLQFQLARELLLADAPLACRPGQQVVFEELLVVLEGRHDLVGHGLQLTQLRRLAGHLVDAALVKGDRAAVLAQGCLDVDPRRIGQVGFGRHRHGWDTGHAGGDALDRLRFRDRRLRQRQEDAVADVFVVDARIDLEGVAILGKPEAPGQVVLEDFEVDLPAARQFGMVDLARQVFESLAVAGSPALAHFRRHVVEPIVEAMISQPGGIQRLVAEFFFEVGLEELF